MLTNWLPFPLDQYSNSVRLCTLELGSQFLGIVIAQPCGNTMWHAALMIPYPLSKRLFTKKSYAHYINVTVNGLSI